MKKKFVTIFPRCENVHLLKDVGLIPFVLYKYYGFDSLLVGYKTPMSKLSYLNNEVKGLKYHQVINKHGVIIDILLYLLKNARKIDVLQLYHVTSRENFYWIFLYKFLNPRGIVYLKLDADKKIFDNFDYFKHSFKFFIKRRILSLCKIISAETKELCNDIEAKWKINVSFITNGFLFDDKNEFIPYSNKKNIFLTVGRIGTRQKNTEELLNAFALSADSNFKWELRLVGPIDNNFNNYIDNYFTKYPHLKSRVIFTGPIYDRKQLEQEYINAKVFVITSRWEGFCISKVEALKYGCFLVSSNVNGSHEISCDNKFGFIYDLEDSKTLMLYLSQIMSNDSFLEEKCFPSQLFAYHQYNWKLICSELVCLINK